MVSRVVALLPMKAHSARVKSKNFATFAGKPLYQWMLSKLVAMDELDAIYINTDAHAELSAAGFDTFETRGKVTLRKRPDEICGDHVSMNLIIADDLAHVDADTFVMTHTTNPLLSTDTVRRALAVYSEAVAAGTGDSLFTAQPDTDAVLSRGWFAGEP